VITLELPSTLKARLKQGHPWVYRNHVPTVYSHSSGTWLQVRCDSFSAYGLWDSQSRIAVRIFSRRTVPDSGWVADRVSEAWDLRTSVRATSTNTYRWIYGESDGLPGIVVDLYGEFAVIRTYVESVEQLVPWVADALHAHTSLHGILWRRAAAKPESFWGRIPPGDLVVEEHGLLYCADLFSGQKTGLFLDQRENRRTFAPWCQGKTVLDCFCYTGGFSLHAARAGAASITACDVAAGAIEAAQRNFALNSLPWDQHTFLVQDAFEALEQFAAKGMRFDVVLLDPPSFARDRKSRRGAVRAYIRLNQAAIRCVNRGGLLASGSCTSQVSSLDFHQVLAEAASRAGRRLLVLHDAGQAVDHPVPPFFPEARYLKFVIGRVLNTI
jgi:23S rRNA (cytosine1962-C5)-methyltransferase